MSGRSPILDYEESPPAGRRWRIVQRAILVMICASALLFIAGLILENTGHRVYADLNSGDVMTEHYFAGVCWQKEIRSTPFSRAVRKYLGPTPAANWVFADGKIGATFEDGIAGGSLNECNEVILATTLVQLTDAEMKSLLKRCAGDLANNDKDAMYDETLKLADRMK